MKSLYVSPAVKTYNIDTLMIGFSGREGGEQYVEEPVFDIRPGSPSIETKQALPSSNSLWEEDAAGTNEAEAAL